ncbi:bifunctional phosphoglucose phosphomannose isomerase [Fusarium sp. NRRL 52700]|nr:bifunctional phosphoglucose phosphomannose isomerase [Fusarium sp. NRRL 52700]
MFFNEIAMVPTHRNLLHEFSHTEVAAYSNPTEKQAIVTFLDSNADQYTKDMNKNIECINVDLSQDNFFKSSFTGTSSRSTWRITRVFTRVWRDEI